MNVQFYKVGGCVRDRLLGLNPKDIDFVVLAQSFDEMRQAVLDRGGEIFLESPEYQTIRGRLPEIGAADFALPRVDGDYSDGRRPDHTQIASSLYEDSCRRDFTVNAMYEDIDTGEVLDYHNGQRDLRMNLLRCVGNPEDRFQEDSLRMLRFIRFLVVKGFSPSLPDLHFIFKNINLLDGVSEERIREELYKCFRADTLLTLKYLTGEWAKVGNYIFTRTNLWLKPTFEK